MGNWVRGREGPKEILNNFKGYLQTDGYAAYEDFAVAEGITLLHCMAHARRKFHEALDNDEQRANYALEEIQKLYIIERTCKENQLSFTELKEVRQKNQFRSCGIWAYGCSSNMFRYCRKVRSERPLDIACNAGSDYPYTLMMAG